MACHNAIGIYKTLPKLKIFENENLMAPPLFGTELYSSFWAIAYVKARSRT